MGVIVMFQLINNAKVPYRPREQAIKNNDLLYFTGKPCKLGHIAKRYTNGQACVECTKLMKIATKCNVGIGQLNHSPEILRKAAIYCEDV